MSGGALLLRALAAEPGVDPALARATADLWTRAREPWPQIALAPGLFLPYVAERLPAGADPAAVLAALHAGDLYLACACVHGDARALEAFERTFMSRVAAYLARADALPAFTDEVKQALRARLLVAEDGLLPRLRHYAGRGPLGAWLWMTATRVAVDLRRTQGDEAAAPLAMLAERAATPDPELAYLKSQYGPAFREAFREALAALPERDASLLRLHYLDGLGTDQLGALYGVSRWTTNRWIARLCRDVLRQTRRTLAARLELSVGQLDSLMRVVKSELALSVRDVLRDGGGQRPGSEEPEIGGPRNRGEVAGRGDRTTPGPPPPLPVGPPLGSPSTPHRAMSLAMGESVDNFIARRLGVEPLALYAGPKGGYINDHISHKGPKDLRVAESNPWLAYTRLIGMGSATASPELLMRLATKRASVNDLVRDEMKELLARKDLSTGDRRRLDAHLTAIREVEVKITTQLSRADTMRFKSVDGRHRSNDTRFEVEKMQMELIAFALAADYTRVAFPADWRRHGRHDLHRRRGEAAPVPPGVAPGLERRPGLRRRRCPTP